MSLHALVADLQPHRFLLLRHASLLSLRMSEKWIDGAALAAQMRADVAARVKELRHRGRAVHLTAVLVGSTPAGELYAQRQREACETVGINYELRKLPA